ncbi:MAG: hypothetical protein KC620_05045, partial [Myxococcales bacterium]|nr:hypothetical protein [Myxococcales bacterium]
MRARLTIGRRLLIGFLALFVIAGGAVAAAVAAAREASEAVRRTASLSEDGRLLARVGALVREFYIHQAHLTLGMD